MQIAGTKITKEANVDFKESDHLPTEEEAVGASKTAPVEDKGFKAIGNDFYVRNVRFLNLVLQLP